MQTIKRCAIFTLLVLGLGLVLPGILVMIPLPAPPLVGVVGDYAITGVKVIDTLTGTVSTESAVLIRDGRIVNVLADNHDEKLSGFTEIPADGKYLIPGLWDMHTHSLKLSPYIHHPLFIRHGVTSVRDMSGCLSEDDSYWACPDDRSLWEQEALDGARVSPRYPLQSSYQTNGGNEVPADFPDFFRLASDNDAQQLVSFYQNEGVDFIKTYTELSKTQYDSLASHAAEAGVAIAGHKPISVSLNHALATGMRSIEHGRLFAFECYEDIAAFRELQNPISHYNADFMRDMLNSQDAETCRGEMNAMAQSSTWWVPTLTTLRMSAEAKNPLFRDDVRLQYIPAVVQKLLWEPDINRAVSKGDDSQGTYVHADFYALAASHIALAQESGISIMSGTDNIDTWVFTGASLHDELAYFVEAGLTPFEALRTATILPARFAGLEQELGSVDIGKRADLVLLNANPLDNISNSADIHAVFFNGRYFNAQALEKLDRYVVDMAGSLRVNIRFLYDLIASPLMRIQLAD
jgi:hypothetical protein